MEQPLCGLVLEIYRAAREMPPREFQDFMLGLVRSLVPFDSSRWVTVELIGKRAISHCAHLINEPTDVVLDWESLNSKDKFMHALKDSLGKALSIHANSYYAGRELAEMRDYTQRYWHANALGIALPTATPGHFEGLTLYRAKQDDHFDDQGRQVLEQLMPHMTEAVAINRMISLSQAGASEPAPERTVMAISDADGLLHFSGSGFGNLVRLEWPDWSGPKLPRSLQQVVTKTGADGYAGIAIAVSATKLGALWFLKARRVCALQRLSQRELDVARLYAIGHSHKDVAEQLAISPLTVRTFLRRIYAKLGIDDKAELAALVAQANR